jgi:hypothetical protein
LTADMPEFLKLKRPAQLMLAKVVRLLLGGFSGEIRIVCNQGGIRSVTASETWAPEDLERLAS